MPVIVADDADMKWTAHHENILIEWGDKAMCYRWLHGKAHAKYSWLNAVYTIPVIIMSTLTGTANFAIGRLDEEYKSYASIAIGGVNIIAGIITTIQQFLKVTELAEAHRASSIAWDKFYRNAKVELARAPEERTPVIHGVKTAKEEFDRLMETSPPIPERIIAKFRRAFPELPVKGLAKSAKATPLPLSRPEICGTMRSTRETLFRADDVVIVPRATGLPSNVSEALLAKARQRKRIAAAYTAFSAQMNRPPSVVELSRELPDDTDDDVAGYIDGLIAEREDKS